MDEELQALLRANVKTTRLRQTTGGAARLTSGLAALRKGSGGRLTREGALGPEAAEELLQVIGPRAVELGALLFASAVDHLPGVRSDVPPKVLEQARDRLMAGGTPEARYFDHHVTQIDERPPGLQERAGRLAELSLDELATRVALPATVRESAKKLIVEHLWAGMRNEALLTFIDRDRAVDELTERVRTMPIEETLLSTQPHIVEWVFEQGPACAAALVRGVPSLGRRPFDETQELAERVTLDAAWLGAKLGRAVLGIERPSVCPELDEAEAASLLAAIRDDGEAAIGARRALRVLGFNPTSMFLAKVVVDCSWQGEIPDTDYVALVKAVHNIVLAGAQMEAALVRAVSELLEEPDLFERLGLGNGVATLSQEPRAPRDALPWPKDGVCRCGAALQPFLFCCHEDSRFALAQVNEVGAHEPVRCARCGVSLWGFRCDRCGSLHTWLKGRVGSHRALEV